MAIPAPHPDLERRREAFIRMKALFDALAAQHPQVDTLSMGMSDDIELAVAEGATMVRVGPALFGRRESGSGRQKPALALPRATAWTTPIGRPSGKGRGR